MNPFALIAIILGLGAVASSSSAAAPSPHPTPPLPTPPVPPLTPSVPWGSFSSCDAALATLEKVSPGIAAKVHTALAGTDVAGLETTAQLLDAASSMYASPYGDAAHVVASCIRYRIAEIKGGTTAPPAWWNTPPMTPSIPSGGDLATYTDANGAQWDLSQDGGAPYADMTQAAWEAYQARGASGIYPPEITASSLPALYDQIEQYAANYPNAPGVTGTAITTPLALRATPTGMIQQAQAPVPYGFVPHQYTMAPQG